MVDRYSMSDTPGKKADWGRKEDDGTIPAYHIDARPARKIPYLHVLYSTDEENVGVITQLGRKPLEIGRKADWSIQDQRISRAHVRLTLKDGRSCVAEDLGSRNGLRLRRVQVAKATLQSGDVFRIGDTLLLFEVNEMLEELQGPDHSSLIGCSGAFMKVLGSMRSVASSSLRVLIDGETGVGKEVFSRELHLLSGRSGPLVPVNCGSIPVHLAEAELFGYRKGAFTGAVRDSTGLYRAADGGTLFLDEVGELPLEQQVKLLRVLETGRVRPVGESKSYPVNVRVACATNRDLKEAVEVGEFRGDLLSRLAEWTITIPPLRERVADILPLFHHFLEREGGDRKIEVDAAEAMVCYSWPYNVRELERQAKVISLVLGPGLPVALQDLAPEIIEIPKPEQSRPAASRSLSEPTRKLPPSPTPTTDELRELLQRYDGNLSRVARHLGKKRVQIYRWLSRFGIDANEFRQP